MAKNRGKFRAEKFEIFSAYIDKKNHITQVYGNNFFHS